MSTWSTLLPGLDDEPIAGVAAEYVDAGRLLGGWGESIELVETEFHRITSLSDLTELRGDTAIALGDLVSTTDSSLSDLPGVVSSLQVIMVAHSDRLAELRTASAEALARANTRWLRAETTSTDLDESRSALAGIERQIRSLNVVAAVDPAAAASLPPLESRRWSQLRDVRANIRSHDDAVDALESSRLEHTRLVDDEAALVGSTILALEGIDLADLSDPNGLVQFATDVSDAVTGVGDDLVNALTALASGLVALAEFALTESLRGLALALDHHLSLLTGLVILHLVVLSAIFPPPPGRGDLGGTYDAENRGPYQVKGIDDEARGRATIAEVLRHTADSDQIAPDEFEIIALDNGAWLVVLPGVTDLSNPNYGWNPFHRSVRDTDQAALESSTSTTIDDNLYAQMVAEAMRRQGVQPGDEVMLVGHSFGADTALDLAADPNFNGDGAFQVTHVVAAAYDSGPQLEHVPDSTEVLVLQNARDIPVHAEAIGHGPVGAFDSFGDGLDSFIDGDPGAGFDHLGDAVGDIGGTDTFDITPRVTARGPNQIQDVFVGGGQGAGHHQNNYIDHVEQTTDPAVAAFFASVAEHGYHGPGNSLAIDVSVE